MKKIGLTALIGVLVVILSFYLYDRYIAPEGSQKTTIEKDDAKDLTVKVTFGKGNLLIQGGSSEWMDATFDFNKKPGLPHVTYKNKRGTGILKVEQKSSLFGVNRRNVTNDWTIQLTNDIPIDLDVDIGVSKATVDLKGLQLKKLKIDSGVSDSTIDLSGEWQNNFKANVNLGVGDVALLLPKQTGVKLTVDKGIGKINMIDFTEQSNGVFVNNAYKTSEITIDIKLSVGIGNVNLTLVE